MGLDGVELIMAVEEKFGVTIADEEAGSMRTVGDLVRLLEQRILRTSVGPCLALPNFLALRRLTREVAADEGLRLRPTTSLIEVLTPPQRRKLWKRLPRLLMTNPPGLLRPLWMQKGLNYFALLLAGICVAIPFYDFGMAPYAYASCLFLILFAVWITLPFQCAPPAGFETFGEITQRLVGLQVSVGGVQSVSQPQILLELSPLVVEQLCVDPDEVVMDARFVEDLNLD